MRLKVVYFNKWAKGGAAHTAADFVFRPEQNGADAIKQIIEFIHQQHGTSSIPNTVDVATYYGTNVADYQLFHTKSGQWLKQDFSLASFVQDDDSIEIKFAKDIAEVHVAMSEGTGTLTKDDLRSVMVDFSEPFRKINPYLVRIFHLNKGKDEFCFRKFRFTESNKVEVLRFINSNLTLREQGIKAGGNIVLLPLSLFFEKSLDQFVPEDIAKSGWMQKNSQKGDAKPTGTKRRWCVLADHFLFYFADNKATSKPNGVVNLEHMVFSYDNGTIRLKTCDNAFRQQMIQYNFHSDTEYETKEWVPLVRQHCFNGDPHRVFGVPLAKLFEAKSNILSPLVKSLNYLDAKGLDREKIFQLKALATNLSDLKEQFDKGKDVVLDHIEDAYLIADLVKTFLRELPEPLFTFELYQPFLVTKPEIEKYNELISKVPHVNQIVIQMLLHFMARVLQHKKNGLEFDNLVVIFGPALLRPSVQQTPEEALKTMPEITNIVKFLVSYRNQLVFTYPTGKREFKLKLKTETFVKAVYDYNSKNQVNAQGEIDLTIKKEEVLQLIDERPGSGWIKVKNEKEEGLVPRNYVTFVDPPGQIEITAVKKKKKDLKKKKSTTTIKRASSSKPLRDATNPDEKKKTRTEEEYVELQNKYEVEVKRRTELEQALAALREEFESFKAASLPPPPPPEVEDIPPPPPDDSKP